MAEILANRILNNEVNLEILQKWIEKQDTCSNDKEIVDLHCSPEGFIPYFINLIHEKALCYDKVLEDSSAPIKNENKTLGDENLVISEVGKQSNEQIICTPKKSAKCNSNANENSSKSGESSSNSYPISPLHNFSNDFSSPKVKKQTYSPNKPPELCLGNFIVANVKKGNNKRNQKKCDQDQRKSRRIKPTLLTKKMSENSVEFQSKSIEIEVEDVKDLRNVLLEDRDKIFSNETVNHDNLSKHIFKNVTENLHDSDFDCDTVTFRENLESTANFYSFLLKNYYVVNLTSEFCFLITLLFQKQISLEKSEDPFKSVQNRIFFSIKVLESNLYLFHMLDRPSLKLLLDNESLKKFSNCIPEEINKIYESENVEKKAIQDLRSNSNTNVCFISDTDNRENFPFDSSFHAFRKQRDTFYEILSIWEKNHLMPTWNFSTCLANKIRFVFNLHNDPINFIHFSRLFKAQLLKSCAGNFEEDENNVNELSTFSSLSGISSEKFSLLKNRITTKQFSYGINSTPTFVGYQEFFKDFILTASNHCFNCHLKDLLITDILDSNEFKCEEKETCSVSFVKKSYVNGIRSLRILAKFLGFLESLPYRRENNNIPHVVLKSQIVVRNQIEPNLNLSTVLNNAIDNSNLIVTIPWVVKYISMLDYVQVRLPKFEPVLNTLFSIYKNTSKIYFDLYTVLLIKLCLGWLFDLPHLPEGAYYNWCFKHEQQMFEQIKYSGADTFAIVDYNVLKICCPYLEEIKNTFYSYCTNRIKHITPLSASLSTSDLINKRIQSQLEEAFFNGHPVSVKKTVEFISERVASGCVKEICYDIIPEFKKKACEELKAICKNYTGRPNLSKEDIEKEIGHFPTIKTEQLEELIKETVRTQISRRIPTCTDLLMSFDALPQTVQFCVCVTTRICNEKINEWLKIHITSDIFNKDYDFIIRTYTTSSKLTEKPKLEFLPCVKHNPDTLGPSALMELIRNLTWDVMEISSSITTESIEDVFENFIKTTKERDDVSNFCFKAITHMAVDLTLNLMTYCADLLLMEDGVFLTKAVIPFFKSIKMEKVPAFNDVICPRNVIFLSQSDTTERTWKCMTLFVSLIMKEELLDVNRFESAVVSLYKFNWNEETLRILSTFYRDVIETSEGYGVKLTHLISFMSDYCSDLSELNL